MDKSNALEVLMQAEGLLKEVKPSEWMTEMFSDCNSKCCALGHYSRLTSEDPSNYGMDNCIARVNILRTASLVVMKEMSCEDGDIATINNGDWFDCGFKQKTPKGRTMAFLRKGIKILS